MCDETTRDVDQMLAHRVRRWTSNNPPSLNLQLSSSSITNRELLSHFSTCRGWRWLEVGGKLQNILLLLKQFHEKIISKILFGNVKWCFYVNIGISTRVRWWQWHFDQWCWPFEYCSAVQSQKAVSAYFTSNKILPYSFAEHCCAARKRNCSTFNCSSRPTAIWLWTGKHTSSTSLLFIFRSS